MPQNPLAATVFKTTGNKQATPVMDVQGNLAIQGGGLSATLNITSGTAVKTSAGRVRKISVLAPGSAGAFTVADAAAVSGIAASNTIWTAPFSGTSAGAVIALDAPTQTGIAVQVASGGTAVVTYD